jgi:glutamate formiminotransferase
MSIKESLLNTCILDNVPKQAIENTLNYYLKINTLIENL